MLCASHSMFAAEGLSSLEARSVVGTAIIDVTTISRLDHEEHKWAASRHPRFEGELNLTCPMLDWVPFERIVVL